MRLGDGLFVSVAVLSLLISSPDVYGLRLIKLIVPEYAHWNHPATLECQYDLERAKLYSVQWYKDNDEFYRFTPKRNPSQLSYHIDDGINVDVRMFNFEGSSDSALIQSNEKILTLKNVNLRMSGIYRCEVSAEAPSFATVYAEAEMKVIALPKEGPRITGEEKAYHVGSFVNLTCTSSKSYPAVDLRWYINDEEVPASSNEVYEYGGLKSTVSLLKLTANSHHFVNGHMQIRCQAKISIGNRSMITIPAHTGLTPSPKSFGYQGNALLSLKGSSNKESINILLLIIVIVYALQSVPDIT